MVTTIIKFQDWTFEVDKALTEKTYSEVSGGGADNCNCNDCKNYIACRDSVFPQIIISLFNELGIDYQKEVEITTWQTLPNGYHHIGGWFHFKGRVLTGKDSRILLASGGYTLGLTRITDNFSLGFAEGNDLTFFLKNTDLVQVEFETNIPWVIDKSLETL